MRILSGSTTSKVIQSLIASGDSEPRVLGTDAGLDSRANALRPGGIHIELCFATRRSRVPNVRKYLFMEDARLIVA